MVFITVSAGYTAAAALAGAATVAELSRAGRSVLEIFGLRKQTLIHAAERTFNCHLWVGFTWRPCVLSMAGDLLVLSGRFVEEARLMESAHVSVQDLYASVALLVGDPLQLCFASSEEAQSFATEIRHRACLKKDMMKLADQAKDLRESLSSATLSSERSGASATQAALASKQAQQTAALRQHLAVPVGVPMYTLSPCASGDLETVEEVQRRTPQYTFQVPEPIISEGSSVSDETPVPPLQINRSNSCPSPSKELNSDSDAGSGPKVRRCSTGTDFGADGPKERPTRLRRKESPAESLVISPRDPDSFASKVFQGLGLDSAKASLVAQKRVDVLKTKFQGAKKGGGSITTRT